MGNTCKPMAVSFQCMTKFTTNKKKIKKKKRKERNDTDLQTPHAVQSLLNNELTQRFSASRLTSYETFLLSLPNLHLNWCNILSPAV